VITEGDEGPDPGQQICAEQDRIDPGDLAARIASAVAEDLMKKTLETFAELQRRVDSRPLVVRTILTLMDKYRITDDQAFGLLRTASCAAGSQSKT
jgi:AmiR/NasT family two-component response regulator